MQSYDEIFGKEPVSMIFGIPQIPYGLALDRTRTLMVGDQQLTSSDVGRNCSLLVWLTQLQKKSISPYRDRLFLEHAYSHIRAVESYILVYFQLLYSFSGATAHRGPGPPYARGL